MTWNMIRVYIDCSTDSISIFKKFLFNRSNFEVQFLKFETTADANGVGMGLICELAHYTYTTHSVSHSLLPRPYFNNIENGSFFLVSPYDSNLLVARIA
jgi:hypothetical protein